MEPVFLSWVLKRKREAVQDLSDASQEDTYQPPPFKQAKYVAPPEFRLIAFSTRDPAETARMILVYAGVRFDNVTLQHSNDPEIFNKVKFPMQFPVLDWNGKALYGVIPITNLLAKKFNLAGQGLFEQAQADNILNIIKEGGPSIMGYFKGIYGIPGFNKEKAYKESFKPAVTHYLSQLEEYAKPTKHGFLLPSGLTFADFAISNIVDLVNFMHPELMKPFPGINMITQRVQALPQLKDYLDKRPSIGEVMASVAIYMKNHKDFKFKNPKHYCVEYSNHCGGKC